MEDIKTKIKKILNYLAFKVVCLGTKIKNEYPEELVKDNSIELNVQINCHNVEDIKTNLLCCPASCFAQPKIITPGFNTIIAYPLIDGKMNGKYECCQQSIKYAMIFSSEYGLDFVTFSIPIYFDDEEFNPYHNVITKIFKIKRQCKVLSPQMK